MKRKRSLAEQLSKVEREVKRLRKMLRGSVQRGYMPKAVMGFAEYTPDGAVVRSEAIGALAFAVMPKDDLDLTYASLDSDGGKRPLLGTIVDVEDNGHLMIDIHGASVALNASGEITGYLLRGKP
jgi:hypothetical protein